MKIGESAAYADALGRRKHFGDGALDPCPDSSGQDHFEPAPCSEVGGLISLTSWGAAPELLPSIVSWGAAPEPLPSTD